jgi:hypothetical protein
MSVNIMKSFNKPERARFPEKLLQAPEEQLSFEYNWIQSKRNSGN